MLIKFNKGDRIVWLNPAEIVEIEPLIRSPGWCLLTLRSKHEHSVEGTVDELGALINSSLESRS